MKHLICRLVLCGCLFHVAASGADPADPHALDTVGKVESLPAQPGPHWVWVYDANLSSMPDGRAYLFDGDSGRNLGTLNTGYSFVAFSLPRRYDAIYSPETYYSRHARGTRTDVVTVYDPVNLAPRLEIPIPAKRASTIPRQNDSALTDDDRFMAVFNLTPATSLSIVDTRTGKFVAEINLSGCSLAFPMGARAFFSLCFNGGALITRIGQDGALDSQQRVEKIFDAEGDFIADHGSRAGDLWLFPSVGGNVYPLRIADRDLKPETPWQLLTESEQGENWRISGFQGSAVHVASGRFFVLLHQGRVDSYKDPGTHVWVYDLQKKKRQLRITLKHAASGIAVSQDGKPVLAAVDMMGRQLDLYEAADGRHIRTIPEVGMTPALVQFPWQDGP